MVYKLQISHNKTKYTKDIQHMCRNINKQKGKKNYSNNEADKYLYVQKDV